MAEWVRSLYFSALNHSITAVSGVGSSPVLATCKTRQVLLAGVSGRFPGVLPFIQKVQYLAITVTAITRGYLT